MDNTRKRRPKSPALPPSPSPSLGGLVRSRSRASSENNSCGANTSQQRSTIVRSRTSRSSTTKSKDEENLNPLKCKTKAGLNKFLKSTTPATSPSAWALSPGRSMGTPIVHTVADGGRSSGKLGGAMSGVMRFFRPKKAAAEAEEVHRFRIMQNRVLQWRYVNGRAHTSMANVTTLAQDRIFSAWLHNLRMRNGILEKRIEVKKLENEIKLYTIIFPQICLLKQWAKLDKRNQESVASLATVLSTFSLRLPLQHGAQVELEAFQQALNIAMEVMAKLETTITKSTYQELEKTLYILTERLSMYKEQEHCLEKLEEAVCSVTTLLAKENSVKIQLMQANKC